MFTGLLSRDGRARLPRLVPGGAILSFHSITTPALPACSDAHVSLDTFQALVRCVQRLGELVPLREFVLRRERGRSTSGLIAITFDDAYAALTGEFRQFVTSAAVPITIFAVTEAMRTGSTFWWDRIEDVYPRVTRDRWQAFEAACGLPESYRHGQPQEFGPLRPLRQWVLANFSGRWPAALEPALRALEREAGYQTLHRSMTCEELQDLARLPWVDVGVHTVSHPVLPLLGDEELRREIADGYRALRDRFERVGPVLAIPFGLYDRRVLRAAREAGMATSLTLAGDIGHHRHGEPALPRFCITTTDTCRRLALRLSGLPRYVRAWSAPAAPAYPDLPSATS